MVHNYELLEWKAVECATNVVIFYILLSKYRTILARIIIHDLRSVSVLFGGITISMNMTYVTYVFVRHVRLPSVLTGEI